MLQHLNGGQRTAQRSGVPADSTAEFVEDAYWASKRLGGRKVTVADVLSSYQKDTNSLRSGYFIQKLFWQKISHKGSPVTPEQVIEEFFRQRDGRQKCLLAVAHFRESCYLKNIPIAGQRVTPDAVAESFPQSPNGKLGLARFRLKCCQDNINLNGRRITTDSVVAELKALSAPLELAYFLSHCCQNDLLIHGQPVTPETVLDAFPDTHHGRLGRAHFMEAWCLAGRRLNGERVPFKAVSDSFPNSQMGLQARGHFKASCCEYGLLFDGQPIPPEMAISDFQAADAQQPLARFLEVCCLKGLLVDGQPVPSEAVVRAFLAANDALGLARFKQACCLAGIKLHGELISADAVIDTFRAIGASLELARFKEHCFLHGLPVKGKALLAQDVAESFPGNALGKLSLTVFKATCCLEGILLNGQSVSAQSIIDNYLAIGGVTEVARFRQSCCEKRININGRPVLASEVLEGYRKAGSLKELAHFQNICFRQAMHDGDDSITQDTVAEGFRASGATLDLVRFREYCCLDGHRLNGEAVTPESVVAGYRGQKEEQMNIGRFKAKCCLGGIYLAGRPVNPEEVLRHFPSHHQGKMARTNFMKECFLRNIAVNGQPVTPESVLHGFPNTGDGKMSQALFRENCCLKGLRIYGRLVTPESVMQNFPDDHRGLISRARFMEKCALRGLSLSGQPISTQEVLANFPETPEGKLAAGRFLEQCLFKGLTLSGQPVTTEVVFTALDTPEGIMAKACFQAECYLRALPLHGQPVDAAAAVAAYPNNRDGQNLLMQFKKRCCLNNLPLADGPVQPEHMVYLLEQKKHLIEKAYFCADLALRARKLNGNYLSNDQVLDAFDQLPGDFSVKKVKFLMQRLIALPEQDYNREAQATFEQAWQILVSIPAKDERFCYQQCVMLFLAMKFTLQVAGQSVTPDQVWQSIRKLRDSLSSTRLRFYFLADCCCTGTALDDQPVSEQQVQDCLQKLPQSRLRLALSHWFEELCSRPRKPDALNRVLSLPPESKVQPQQTRRPKRIEVYIKDLSAGGPFPTEVVEYFDDPGSLDPALINSQTRKALGVVRGINGLCLNGSFSRWLQGVGSSFHDIDMIASQEAINTLITRLTGQIDRQESEAEIHCKVLARRALGCPELRLNPVFTVTLSEGDLGQKTSVLQASAYPPETISALDTTTAAIPGEHGTITCLSFTAEIGLLNDTLQYLSEQLDDLTALLLRGPGFTIPRTILFNYPQRPEERVFGLLMRYLLTLNKARQFLTLLTDTQWQGSTVQQTLQNLTVRLQEQVESHSHRELFVATVTQWLAGCVPASESQIKKCAFIHTLLNTLTPWEAVGQLQ